MSKQGLKRARLLKTVVNSEIRKRLLGTSGCLREHGGLRGRHRSPHYGASRVCARSEQTRGATVLTEWEILD